MIDDELKNSILQSIALEGASLDENKSINLIIASRSSSLSLLHLYSGLPKLRPNLARKFQLILSQPASLSILSPLVIRCCLCGKVISYPAWYMNQRFAVNWFHYFICFDKSFNKQATASCYRRLS